jgi:hypothetical protein
LKSLKVAGDEDVKGTPSELIQKKLEEVIKEKETISNLLF